MGELKFWEGWNKKYKYFLLACSLLPILAVGLFLVAYLIGDSWFYTWETMPEMDYVYIPTASFIDHYQEFRSTAYNYVVQESFLPGIMNLDERVGFVYLGMIALSFSLFMAVSTTFKRNYFYLSLLVSMIFLAFMGLDVLEIFGGKSTAKPVLFTCIIVYALSAYLIYSFFLNLSFIQRVLVFLVITTLVGTVIFALSPFSAHAITLSLLGYSTVALIPITLFFAIVISIEPLSMLLYMNNGRTNSAEHRGSIYRFLLGAFMYLALTILIFLNHKGYVKLEFKGIDIYILLIASSVLGFWGFKRRFGSKSRIENLQYTLVYIVLCTIALSSVAYAIITDNTPLIKMYGWGISTIFMCFTASYLLYLLYNFMDPFMNKQNVYKIMFRPTKFAIFHMWIMATIATAALELKGSKQHWYEALSGYYNFIGDSYFKQEHYDLARKFYLEAKWKNPRNHRSNFCLANVTQLEKKYKEAVQYYDDATEEEPTVHAYASKAYIYSETDQYFKAVFTLSDGLKVFPNDPYLMNNYALLLKKGSMQDSALAILSNSLENSKMEKYDHVQFNNILAHYIKNGMYDKAQELVKLPVQDPAFLTNKLALANMQGQKLEMVSPIEKRFSISQKKLAHIVNYGFNNQNISDSAFISDLDLAIKNPVSMYFREDLIYLMNYLKVLNNNFKEVEPLMSDMAKSGSTMNFHYANVLGLWYMTQKKYKKAQEFFEISVKAEVPQAMYNLAIVTTILNEKEYALSLWNKIKMTGGKEAMDQADQFIRILNVGEKELDALDDEALFNYIVFIDKSKIESVFERGKASDFRKFYEEVFVEYLLENNRLKEAGRVIEEMTDKSGEKFWLLKAIYLTKISQNKEAYTILTEQQYSEYTSYQWGYYLMLNQHALGQIEESMLLADALLLKYPYHEGAILEKTVLLNEQGRNNDAYEFLTGKIQDIPNAPMLLKAYAMQCVSINYISYGRDAMEDLKELLPLQEYTAFEAAFNEKVEAAEKENEVWEEAP